MTQATDRQAPIAALPFKALFDIDALLTKVAETLRSEGRSLAGVIQGRSKAARHVDNLVLRDLADGGESRILQDLGSQSQGCRLNPQALAIISENLMRQLERRPDLLIVNRFGRGEAEGHGLRPVIEKAVTLEVPVLVAVRDEYRPAWEAFSQGVATTLAAEQDPVLAWARANLSATGAAGNAAARPAENPAAAPSINLAAGEPG